MAARDSAEPIDGVPFSIRISIAMRTYRGFDGISPTGGGLFSNFAGEPLLLQCVENIFVIEVPGHFE
jgi:hypothetical protein